MNHFNQGHVFGRPIEIEQATTEKGTPYVKLKISCANPKLGDVTVYGQMYGEKECMELTDFYKQNPTARVRLSGFFHQYKKAEQLRWSFVFFRWSPWTDADGHGERAAFVLIGAMRDRGEDSDADYNQFMDIHLSRKGQEGSAPVEEDFRVYSDLATAFDHCSGAVKVQGYLVAPEGEFGESAQPRPMVHVITVDGKDRRLYDKG